MKKGGLGIRDPTIHSTDALCRGIWPDFEAVVDSAIRVSSSLSTERLLAPRRHGPLSKLLVQHL